MPEQNLLTCPKCHNTDASKISLILPDNPGVLYIDKEPDQTPKSRKIRKFLKTIDKLPRIPFLLPSAFECQECETAFMVDKNGREYPNRRSLILCPKCGFCKFGRFLVWSCNHDPEYPADTPGYRKTYMYDDILFANGFKCPNCLTIFIVDRNGQEIT